MRSAAHPFAGQLAKAAVAAVLAAPHVDRPCLLCGAAGAVIELKVGRVFARVCDRCGGGALGGLDALMKLASVATWVKRTLGG